MTVGRARAIFDATNEFLKGVLLQRGSGDFQKVVRPYLVPKSIQNDCEFLHELIHQSYNRTMGPKVIGGPISSNKQGFEAIVCNYDASAIELKWMKEGSEGIFRQLAANNFVRNPDGKRNILWRLFSRSVFDAAKFVKEHPLVDLRRQIDGSELAILGAIQLVSAKIGGYGFALASSVLKEVGLIDSVKPDTHIKKIAKLLSWPEMKDSTLLIEMNRLCRTDSISQYEFDKVV